MHRPMRLQFFLLVLFLVSSVLFAQRQLILPVVIDGMMDEDREYESSIWTITPLVESATFSSGFTDDGGWMKVWCYGYGIPPAAYEEVWRYYELGSYAGGFTRLCSPFGELNNGWIQMILGHLGEEENQRQYYTEIILKDRKSGEILNVTTVPAVEPATDWLATGYNKWNLVSQANTYKIAYAIVDPSPDSVATVVMENAREEDPCRVELTLQPETRIAKFIDELAACELPSTIRISSDIPIAVAAIKVIQPGYHFYTLPVHVYKEGE